MRYGLNDLMTERTKGARPDYKALNAGKRITIQDEHSLKSTTLHQSLTSETTEVATHNSSSSPTDNSREAEVRSEGNSLWLLDHSEHETPNLSLAEHSSDNEEVGPQFSISSQNSSGCEAHGINFSQIRSFIENRAADDHQSRAQPEEIDVESGTSFNPSISELVDVSNQLQQFVPNHTRLKSYTSNC